MPLRLTEAALDALPRTIERPNYDRSALVPGIVHFGPGAFFRAHQASYVDAVLAHDRRWSISAVALNSTGVADALRPQDGLYTLTLLGHAARTRVVGAVVELPTRIDDALVLRRLAAPETRLVTATVTEKGYCLAPDGTLDLDHPAIAADLAEPHRPGSLIGWLVHGLAHRRAAFGGGLTILSCDNLAANGTRLGGAVRAFAAAVDADLARWIADTVRFPCSMVDSITPATDEALRGHVRAAGVEDAWPVQRETFAQWVIEDDFVGERPPLDLAGATFTASVAAWEETKLRLLNGAHSALAYLGLLLGLETVRDAMADPDLGGFAARLMREDIAPTLAPARGIDLDAYIDAVLARFRDPAIRHLLSQIAWDGSQKLPIRLLSTIAEARAAGRDVERLALPVAAWLRFVALSRPPAPPLVDPRAAILTGLAGDPDALVERSGVFPPDLVGDAVFRAALRTAWQALHGPDAVRAALR
jgi:fructuronate reductase